MRLFFALPVPPSVARRAAALREDVGPARWIPEAQLHLTLRFLGEVDPAVLDPLAAEVERAVVPPDQELRLEGLGRFGWRVLFARVTPEAPVRALATQVEAAVRSVGLPAEDRAFHPHVTLARLKRGARRGAVRALEERAAAFRSPAWRADALHLVQSHLGPDGARHETIRRWPA